jgi:hypothetical protein
MDTILFFHGNNNPSNQFFSSIKKYQVLKQNIKIVYKNKFPELWNTLNVTQTPAIYEKGKLFQNEKAFEWLNKQDINLLPKDFHIGNIKFVIVMLVLIYLSQCKK